MFATASRVRAMLAQSDTVQAILGVDSVESALSKILTFSTDETNDGVPTFTYPMILLRDPEIHLATDAVGKLVDVTLRHIEVWIGLYVPDLDEIESINDEHAWVLDKFSQIIKHCMDLSGDGVCIPGESYPCVTNPVFSGVDREPDDERGDERTDPQPGRPRWFGLFLLEVR